MEISFSKESSNLLINPPARVINDNRHFWNWYQCISDDGDLAPGCHPGKVSSHHSVPWSREPGLCFGTSIGTPGRLEANWSFGDLCVKFLNTRRVSSLLAYLHELLLPFALATIPYLGFLVRLITPMIGFDLATSTRFGPG